MTADEYRKLFNLDGRVALVIGGASGIGQAAAEALAAFGARVVVGDIAPAGADAIHVDVTSTTSVDAAVAETLQRHGRIDVLLTTPARNLRKRLIDYTDEEFDRVIDLNLKGTFRVARAVAKPMMRQRSGTLVSSSGSRAPRWTFGVPLRSTKTQAGCPGTEKWAKSSPWDKRMDGWTGRIVNLLCGGRAFARNGDHKRILARV